MNKEEILKAIKDLPKVKMNNPISAMNGISVDELMIAVDRFNKVPTYDELLKENTQLKEQRQELRSWLEEALNELKQNDIYDRTSYEMGQVIATECIIEKLNELEGGKNE